jgi:cell division septation protein DedD
VINIPASLLKSPVPDVTRQTAPAAGILKTISSAIATPSTKSTTVVVAILSCVLVSGLIGVFRPDVASRAFQTIHKFMSEKGATARPTERVSVLPPSASIRRKLDSSVSSIDFKSSPSLPSPAARPTEDASVLPHTVPVRREPDSSVSSMNPTSSPPLPSPSPRDLRGKVFQIAAMEHVDNANRLVESLKGNNFPAFVFRRSGDRFYKVFVGPYDDPRSVGIVKVKLTMQGIKAIEMRWLP